MMLRDVGGLYPVELTRPRFDDRHDLLRIDMIYVHLHCGVWGFQELGIVSRI